ncbi:MAG: CPBP family intramembrane metalloprotease [Flammeovirgaceae bacterium]|nr:MAG: CPBP family intramembrane metalloprotease [Flammeovirgaceae bacterium]
MNTNPISDRHPAASLIYILFVVAIGFLIIGPSLGLLLASPFYDGDLFSEFTGILYNQSNPQLFTALMIVQGTAGIIGLIVLPLLYLNAIEHKSIRVLFRKEANLPMIIIMLTAIGTCFTIAISPVIEWNMNLDFPDFLSGFERWAKQKENELMEVTRFLTTFSSPTDFLIGLFVVAVIPGIGEELVFRGFVQNELHRGTNSIHVAIWVSAFLFSAMHMQFFGFMPRMLLGALFGYLYYWSGNLLIPMLAHFFHNGLTLALLYTYQRGITTLDPESNEAAPLPLVLGCVAAVVGLLYYFRKLYQVNNHPPS